MNGHQLFTFLTMDPCTGPLLKGMAMSDSSSLKNIHHPRAMYVLNTDVEKGKGEHWCMLYFEDELCEFFDPFGMPTSAYQFENLLKLRTGIKKVIHNHMCVQNIQSKACGAHCLFYAFHRSRGVPLTRILAMYDKFDMTRNDEMVENFVLSFGEGYSIKGN
jgi:hypothetical protein